MGDVTNVVSTNVFCYLAEFFKVYFTRIGGCTRDDYLWLVLFDLDNVLRSWLKYGHDFEATDDSLEAARTALHDEMEKHGVSLGMMS